MHLNFAQASTHYYQNDADVLIDPTKQIEIFNELSDRTQSEGRGIIKYLESHYQSLAVEFLKNIRTLPYVRRYPVLYSWIPAASFFLVLHGIKDWERSKIINIH